jgi:hypothetical protein
MNHGEALLATAANAQRRSPFVHFVALFSVFRYSVPGDLGVPVVGIDGAVGIDGIAIPPWPQHSLPFSS